MPLVRRRACVQGSALFLGPCFGLVNRAGFVCRGGSRRKLCSTGGDTAALKGYKMDYIIETNFQGPGFVAVPNAVAQSADLSPEALGVLVYLASLPRGFVLRVSSVMERFKMGKDRWQRIAREFRDVGVMPQKPEIVRGAGGRAVGRRVSVRWPEVTASTESRENQLSDRKPEKPADGKPAKVSRKTRQSERENPAPYKEQEKEKGRVACQAAPRASASRAPVARPMGGGSGLASVSDEKRPSDPWARAASAAAVGMDWLHPATGQWRKAADFGKIAENERGVA